jgi:hypothetical protein
MAGWSPFEVGPVGISAASSVRSVAMACVVSMARVVAQLAATVGRSYGARRRLESGVSLRF